MQPIVFQCSQVIAAPGTDITSAIADTALWNQFKGYWILPGIESAEYEVRTEDMVGSRIRVRSTDGSEYVEEIYRWVPGHAVGMKLHEFSPPLSHFATHFLEEWSFRAEGKATVVTRTLRMFPSRPLARPIVWVISHFMRRAIARHLAQIAAAS